MLNHTSSRSQIGRIGKVSGRTYRAPAPSGSGLFVPSTSPNYDGLVLDTLPTNFGAGEFAFEMDIQPTPAGGGITVASTATIKTNRWSSDNQTRYSSASWWPLGNFLLDGHNNTSSVVAPGSFNLQFYDGGRLRWLFADDAADSPTGGLWAPQGGAQLIDGTWSKIICV